MSYEVSASQRDHNERNITGCIYNTSQKFYSFGLRRVSFTYICKVYFIMSNPEGHGYIYYMNSLVTSSVPTTKQNITKPNAYRWMYYISMTKRVAMQCVPLDQGACVLPALLWCNTIINIDSEINLHWLYDTLLYATGLLPAHNTFLHQSINPWSERDIYILVRMNNSNANRMSYLILPDTTHLC